MQIGSPRPWKKKIQISIILHATYEKTVLPTPKRGEMGRIIRIFNIHKWKMMALWLILK